MNKTLWLAIIGGGFAIQTNAQSALSTPKESPNGWHMMDHQKDGYYGIQIEKAYEELLKNKKSVPVIVAVIDSGIDTLHEDLKPVFWVNSKEIPGNGIDDDNNGYVDDVNGWNFLGNKDGTNVTKDSYEAARVYYNLKKKFGDQVPSEEGATDEQLKEIRLYKELKQRVANDAREASMTVMFLKDIVSNLDWADSTIKIALNKKEYTGDDLKSYSPESPDENKAKSYLTALFMGFQANDMTSDKLITMTKEYYESQIGKVEAAEKEPEEYRNNVVKDNYNDVNDRGYGNHDLMAGTSMHGTHVAGIIGAVRGNNIGVKGVADNVQLMTLRAVPDGDEHDKDIANAIRYAVDNGARVINMSFGKSISPQKHWVDEAVKYAEQKGVLLVHAAGNDAKNTDIHKNYPNAFYNDDSTTKATNWISVGASGDPTNGGIVGSFSNYGKRSVDVFAPGVKIYSTMPGGNEYGNLQGTSMASPVVAGVSALLFSYFPQLTPAQVVDIIKESSSKLPDTKVTKPGTQEDVLLTDLSVSGGIVNAYEAIKLAEAVTAKKTTEKKPKKKKK